MRKTYFYDGGFALYDETYRAWYNADGTLKDCERKVLFRGHPAARAIPASAVRVRATLADLGRGEVATERHAAELAAYRAAFNNNFAATKAALIQAAA